MKLPFQSIRWRLLLWHSLISLGLVVAVALLAYRFSARERLDRINRDLANQQRTFFYTILQASSKERDDSPPTSEEVRARLLSLGDPASDPPEFRDRFKSDPPGAYIAVWDEDGTPLFISPNAPSPLGKPVDPPRGEPRIVTRGPFHELQRGHSSGFVTIVGRDVSPDLTALRRYRILLALGGAAILLAAIAGGWWLAGRALRPIGAISHTASRIAAGNLRERIALGHNDSELDQLARVLNDTFDRLASAIERQKRFTADASHELRTPLTIILTETQRSLKTERDTAQYREFLSHCQSAAKRMRAIVDSLLVLVRLDTDTPPQPGLPCDLAEAAAAVASRMATLAAERATTIHLQLRPAPVTVAPEALDTLLENLVSNALSHPPHGTPVTLRSFIHDRDAIIEVHDSGPPIPPEHLPKIFDRFYRADPARTQSTGHSGLGLAIARSIAASLGGKLEAESNATSGTTFRLILPLATDPAADDRSAGAHQDP